MSGLLRDQSIDMDLQYTDNPLSTNLSIANKNQNTFFFAQCNQSIKGNFYSTYFHNTDSFRYTQLLLSHFSLWVSLSPPSETSLDISASSTSAFGMLNSSSVRRTKFPNHFSNLLSNLCPKAQFDKSLFFCCFPMEQYFSESQLFRIFSTIRK